MKKILILMAVCIAIAFTSCNKNFLEEKPTAFLNSENAYQNYDGFNATIVNLYGRVRHEFYSMNENRPFDYLYGTDVIFDGQAGVDRHTNMIATYNPVSNIPLDHWNNLYKIIAEANIVISRAPTSDMSDAQQTEILAQAHFFRGFAYRTLAYLFGGVPLIEEELTAPKTDLTRVTKEEVLNFVIAELQFAAQHLPVIDNTPDGKLSSEAAHHLLAEVYLAANRPQDAILAANQVINNPNLELMLDRFGSRATQPGDVYWDLFRERNQNRSSGNKESIWVIQFETDVIGGGAVSTGRGGSYPLERHHVPGMDAFRVNGVNPFLFPSRGTGGRGIGWARSTVHLTHGIWQSDFNNDIRNSNYNFVRETVANNPASPLFGQIISTENPPPGAAVAIPDRQFYAYQSKATTIDHPSSMYLNPTTGQLTSAAGATYLDQYMFRLAETYLLRAEAYLALDDLINAADDINAVRSRSNASPAEPSDVTIDYILDERMREFGVEEKRRITLMRLGLLYDRVVRLNPYYAGEILEIYNVWPIPAAEIERNKDAVLTQNPGY